MIYRIEDIKQDSRWISKSDSREIEIRYVYPSFGCLQYFYLSNPNRYYESSLEGLLDYFKPKPKTKVKEGSILLGKTGKKVGDLLNDDMVVVILTEGVYKGGYTTNVKYELADFMDDEPPFIEVSFITKQGDTVFFTEDLSQPVYELDGLLVVKAKGV